MLENKTIVNFLLIYKFIYGVCAHVQMHNCVLMCVDHLCMFMDVES